MGAHQGLDHHVQLPHLIAYFHDGMCRVQARGRVLVKVSEDVLRLLNTGELPQLSKIVRHPVET